MNASPSLFFRSARRLTPSGWRRHWLDVSFGQDSQRFHQHRYEEEENDQEEEEVGEFSSALSFVAKIIRHWRAAWKAVMSFISLLVHS